MRDLLLYGSGIIFGVLARKLYVRRRRIRDHYDGTPMMNIIRENWGFIALGAAGGLAWALIAWAMHRSSRVLAPPCRYCLRGFHRNDRDGKIDPKGDRHWIETFDCELEIEECTNPNTPNSCPCHKCRPTPIVVVAPAR